jgi:hypothetical protein
MMKEGKYPMSIGLLFWVLMILWIVSWIGTRWGAVHLLRLRERVSVLRSLVFARLGELWLHHSSMMRRSDWKRPAGREQPPRWKVGLFIVVAVAIFAWFMTELSVKFLPNEQTTEEHK